MITFSLENLFYFYLGVPIVLGFVLYSFYLSLSKYNCLVLDYGRVLYTISYIFITLKGFLDMGRPPFFKFHEQMNIFYFHLPLCLNTFISSFMYEIYFHYSYHFCGCVVRPPRKSVCLVLSIGVNFLLHHRNRAN